MKVYIAGPMRGYPDFNFPAFDKAAKALYAMGHKPCNPADHDREKHGDDFSPETADDKGFDLREALGWDLRWILENAEAVAVLSGWEASPGARTEVALAHALGLPVAPYQMFNTVVSSAEWSGEPYRTDQILPGDIAPVEGEKPLRAEVLEEAARLITGDRNKSYGSPTQNFQNTADMWTVQFSHMLKDGAHFTASHIAQAMSLLKLARMIAGAKRDNWTDLAGYAGCGAECDEEAQS